MSKTTKKMFEADRRPYLSFVELTCNFGSILENSINCQLGLRLQNVGRVLLSYKVISFGLSLNDVKNENPRLDNNGDYVFPNSFAAFSYDVIRSIPFHQEPIHGVLEYRIEYKANESNKIYKSTRKLKIEIYPSKKRINWSYLDSYEE
jgi:hypothetical protein